ncbi:MAG: ABC transporter permease [Planctomycetota bacterium]|jgi:ABC-type transport system involved in multi-copper enzyme maturation permease subunit
MRGLVAKTIRETWLATLLFGVGMLLVERLLMYVLPQAEGLIDDVLVKMPFVRQLIGGLMNLNLEGEISAQLLQAIVWVHPTVLTLVWAQAILFCTRFPAGEIDRGTIDVLLGWPVSRRTVFLAETSVGLVYGAAILGLGFTGYLLGAASMDPQARPAIPRLLTVLVNFYALYVAVGGVTMLIASLCDRRARAIGIVFGVLLASFLLNFLARTWEPAQKLSFLGVLEYYQPATIVADGGMPWRDLAVLLGVGAVAWTAAGEIIARRSICTV